MLTVVFTFLFIDMFDTMDTVIGVSQKAGMVDDEGHVDGIDGILIGMIAYVALNAVTGIFDHQYLKKITPTMWILAILFVLRYIFI